MSEVEALLEAVRADDADAVREILDRDPELLRGGRDAGGSAASPVLEALYHGSGGALEVLLEADPALDVHEAAALGRVDRLRELLDADPGRASGFGPGGWTPLHLACFFGGSRAVRLLLDAGAPVEATSRNATANRPLHAALAGGAESEAVTALLEAGADVGARAGGGYTPLHLAASRGAVELVEALLEREAEPSARSDDGSTPAEIAEERGHPEVAARLR